MQHLHTFSFAHKSVKKLLLPLMLLFAQSIHSQVSDSAFTENIYNNGWIYIYGNPDSATWFFEKAKKESEKRKYLPGIVMYHNYNAALQIALGQNEKAFEHYDLGIAFAKKNNLTADLGITYIKKGTLNQFIGEYARAAEFYLAADSLLKTNENRKRVIGLYGNIISTLANLREQNLSLQNVLPALKKDNTTEKEIVSILSGKKTDETSLNFPDQTTLREVTGGEMYVIFGGAKFHVADYAVLNKYSNFRSIRKIPDGMLSRIPDIPRDGTVLIQFNDSKVYLVKDGRRHRIENPEVMQYFGGWDAICAVPDNGLQQVPDAGDLVTMQNVNTTFNFKKEYEVLIDTLRTTLLQNTWLLGEVGKKLKAKNNVLQKRKILLWTSLVGITALLYIGFLLIRNSRQKQKLYWQSLQTLKAEQELQRKMEVEKERTRIATDMHDDLGAGLSKIRFLSETVQRNSTEKVHQPNLQNIASSSVELIDKFNEIIWAMNEKNNSLEDLLYYIRNYTAKYCTENNLGYKITLPEDVPSVLINGEMRSHIFLTVKESLHNIVKHAGAENVWLSVQTDNMITIILRDDGKGFVIAGMKNTGNGLRNMEQRIKSINGKLVIENKEGTLITITIPFKAG